MDLKELDEYVSKYGFDNKTGITDAQTAMTVNKIREEKSYGTNTL